jgi:quercetin dioxygenase-like cupin family protein
MHMSTIEQFGATTAEVTTKRRPSGAQVILLLGAAGGAALSLFAFVGPNKVATPSHHHHGVTVHAQSTAESGAEAQRPATVVTPISCERLPNVPGKSITMALVDFPPGAYSPRHRHPGSVTAFVLKGTLRSQLQGGPVGTFTVGQTWFEPPGTIHLFAENASATEPAQLLATFVAEDDCGPLTIRD